MSDGIFNNNSDNDSNNTENKNDYFISVIYIKRIYS